MNEFTTKREKLTQELYNQIREYGLACSAMHPHYHNIDKNEAVSRHRDQVKQKIAFLVEAAIIEGIEAEKAEERIR